MSTEGKIECTLTAPGYRSSVDFPVDAEAATAFCAWFEMQLDYLKRWRPGATASISENTPTGAKP